MPDAQKWGIFSGFNAFLLTKEIVPCLKKMPIFFKKSIRNARLASLGVGGRRHVDRLSTSEAKDRVGEERESGKEKVRER